MKIFFKFIFIFLVSSFSYGVHTTGEMYEPDSKPPEGLSLHIDIPRDTYQQYSDHLKVHVTLKNESSLPILITNYPIYRGFYLVFALFDSNGNEISVHSNGGGMDLIMDSSSPITLLPGQTVPAIDDGDFHNPRKEDGWINVNSWIDIGTFDLKAEWNGVYFQNNKRRMFRLFSNPVKIKIKKQWWNFF